MSIDEKVQEAPKDVGNDQQYGFMNKINDSMKNSKLYRGIVGVLGGLALTYAVNTADIKTGMNKAHAEQQDHCDIVECVEGGVKLPDLSDARYLGKNGPYDKFDSIEGSETVIRGYKMDNKIFALYTLPNEKVYGFGVKDLEKNVELNFWDSKNDGIFEHSSKDITINLGAYAY